MGYNPFDFLGTDKRKRVSSKAMSMAKDDLQERKKTKGGDHECLRGIPELC